MCSVLFDPLDTSYWLEQSLQRNVICWMKRFWAVIPLRCLGSCNLWHKIKREKPTISIVLMILLFLSVDKISSLGLNKLLPCSRENRPKLMAQPIFFRKLHFDFSKKFLCLINFFFVFFHRFHSSNKTKHM